MYVWCFLKPEAQCRGSFSSSVICVLCYLTPEAQCRGDGVWTLSANDIARISFVTTYEYARALLQFNASEIA